MLQTCNLYLNLAEHPLFRKAFLAIRLLGPRYQSPKRNAVEGLLLDKNHQDVTASNDVILTKYADDSGLAMKGDGATIKKKPLFNILASHQTHLP